MLEQQGDGSSTMPLVLQKLPAPSELSDKEITRENNADGNTVTKEQRLSPSKGEQSPQRASPFKNA